MNRSVERLLVLLAAGRPGRKELADFHDWVTNASRAELESVMDDIEARIADIDAYRERHSALSKRGGASADPRPPRRHAAAKKTPKSPNRQSYIYQIVSLLRDDVGLSAAEAHRLMRTELECEGVRGDQIPSVNKRGLETWISRLCETIPPSVVFHVASRIRDKAVKHGARAWPLKGENNR